MNSSKKSLLIPGDFPPVCSGIATYFHEIWRYFSQDNHIILAPKDQNFHTFDSNSRYNVIRINIPTSNSYSAKILKGLLYSFHAIRLHLKYKFKVVHCGQVLSSGFSGWLLKKLFGVPYFIYVYGSETFRFGSNKLLMKCIKSFLINADKIIPNSNFTKEEFLAIGIPDNKFSLVTPGVDINRFSPTNKDTNLIKKYNLQNKKVLLTVARLDERKGHDKVIEAFPALLKENPNLVYLVVGKGREQQRLEVLSEELKIKDKIIFCGYVPDNDLPKYYNLCDIFILLNRQTSDDPRLSGDYEGFGIVFLEASACSKPVIAGNYGGIRDAIEDEKSGYIIDGTNILELTQVVNKLLTNSDLCTQIGQYGRKRAEKYFTWKLISSKIYEIENDCK